MSGLSIRYGVDDKRRALCDHLSFFKDGKLLVSRKVVLALVDCLPEGEVSGSSNDKCCTLNRPSKLLFLAPGQSEWNWLPSSEDPYFAVLGSAWDIEKSTTVANQTLSARFEEEDLEDKRTVENLLISSAAKKEFRSHLESISRLKKIPSEKRAKLKTKQSGMEESHRQFITVDEFRNALKGHPEVIDPIFWLLHKAGVSMNAFEKKNHSFRPQRTRSNTQSSQTKLTASDGAIEIASHSEQLRSGGLLVRFRAFPLLWTAMSGLPLCICYWFTDYAGWIDHVNVVVSVLPLIFVCCTLFAYLGRPRRLHWSIQWMLLVSNALFWSAFLVNMYLMSTKVSLPDSLYGQMALYNEPTSSCVLRLLHMKFNCPAGFGRNNVTAESTVLWMPDQTARCEFKLVSIPDFDANISPVCVPELVYRVGNESFYYELPLELGRADHEYESLHYNGARLFNNWSMAFVVLVLITIGSSWGNGTRFACLDLVWLARVQCGGSVGGKLLYHRSKKSESAQSSRISGSLLHDIEISSNRVWYQKYRHDALAGSMLCGLLVVLCFTLLISFTFTCIPFAGLSCFQQSEPVLISDRKFVDSRGSLIPQTSAYMLIAIMAPVLAIIFVSLFRLFRPKLTTSSIRYRDSEGSRNRSNWCRTTFRWQSILFSFLVAVSTVPQLAWVFVYQSTWITNARREWLMAAIMVPLSIRMLALAVTILAAGKFIWICVKAFHRHQVRVSVFSNLIASQRQHDGFAFVEENRDVAVQQPFKSTEELYSWRLLRIWVLDHYCRRYLTSPFAGLSFAIAFAMCAVGVISYGVLFEPNVEISYWITLALTPVLMGALAGVYGIHSLSSMNQMADSHVVALEQCRLDLCSTATRNQKTRILMASLERMAQLLSKEPKHFRLFGIAVTPKFERALLIYASLAVLAIVLKVGFGLELGL